MSDTDSQAESTEMTLLRELVVLQKENNEKNNPHSVVGFGVNVAIALLIVLSPLFAFGVLSLFDY